MNEVNGSTYFEGVELSSYEVKGRWQTADDDGRAVPTPRPGTRRCQRGLEANTPFKWSDQRFLDDLEDSPHAIEPGYQEPKVVGRGKEVLAQDVQGIVPYIWRHDTF